MLVKVLAVGVNPVETYLRAGTNNYAVKVGLKITVLMLSNLIKYYFSSHGPQAMTAVDV